MAMVEEQCRYCWPEAKMEPGDKRLCPKDQGGAGRFQYRHICGHKVKNIPEGQRNSRDYITTLCKAKHGKHRCFYCHTTSN